MTTNSNTGHGHVFPRPDGVKARCGGPALCRECAKDQARYLATFDEMPPAQKPVKMRQSQFGVDIINRYNDENCTVRLTIRNNDGDITDILEGPMRFIIRELMECVSPETKLGIRKVKK